MKEKKEKCVICGESSGLITNCGLGLFDGFLRRWISFKDSKYNSPLTDIGGYLTLECHVRDRQTDCELTICQECLFRELQRLATWGIANLAKENE